MHPTLLTSLVHSLYFSTPLHFRQVLPLLLIWLGTYLIWSWLTTAPPIPFPGCLTLVCVEWFHLLVWCVLALFGLFLTWFGYLTVPCLSPGWYDLSPLRWCVFRHLCWYFSLYGSHLFNSVLCTFHLLSWYTCWMCLAFLTFVCPFWCYFCVVLFHVFMCNFWIFVFMIFVTFFLYFIVESSYYWIAPWHVSSIFPSHWSWQLKISRKNLKNYRVKFCRKFDFQNNKIAS